MRFVATAGILILGAGASLWADTLTLRSGEVVQGTYLGGTPRQIRMDLNGTIRTYEIDRVQGVNFSDSTAPGIPDRTPEGTRDDRSNQSLAPGASGQAQGITIPADTNITIRMIDAVNSQTARQGQAFRASLDEPVVVNGQVAIPRGADVWAKLVEDRQSGKIQGKTVLTLALTSITVNGQVVDVSTSDVRTESASRGARSAKVIGGGTALGAMLGAIAGGGAGAAIGAASGAAVGTGAQVLTNGQQVKIPSETRLTFRLQTPVQL